MLLRESRHASCRFSELDRLRLSVNTCNDRETTGYSARDYVDAIVRTLNRSDRPRRPESNKRRTEHPADALITHVVHTENGEVPIDTWDLLVCILGSTNALDLLKGDLRSIWASIASKCRHHLASGSRTTMCAGPSIRLEVGR